MKYKVSIHLEAKSKDEAKKAVEMFGIKVNEVELVREFRSSAQNKALHKFFQLLADELNEKGFDMRATLSQENPISWTGASVKEYMWRPLQKALFNKDSTTKLDKNQEIDTIIDNLNRIITERTKGEIVLPEFPHNTLL